ncbi:Cell division protein FtsZ, partial [Bienertia sinuspersici]
MTMMNNQRVDFKASFMKLKPYKWGFNLSINISNPTNINQRNKKITLMFYFSFEKKKMQFDLTLDHIKAILM